jgi:NTP pyrophosphatase (non-canonical NTP hydrolase)
MTKEVTPQELYANVILEWGIAAQVDMAIEECSELINALEKYRRGRVSEKEVITEIADVMIMCEQMAFIFGEEAVEEEKHFKLDRLLKRLLEHLKQKGNAPTTPPVSA